MWSLLVQVTLAFLAVTLDEFVVLILFFARSFQPEETLLTSQVVLGHIVGFTLVLVLSLAVGCAGLVIPASYLSLLGLIPISLGVYDLYKRLPRFCGTAASAYGAISSDKMGNSSRSESSSSSSQGEDPEIGFADDTDDENAETDDYSPVTIDGEGGKSRKRVEMRSVGAGSDGGEQAHLLASQQAANYAAVPRSPSSSTIVAPPSIPTTATPLYPPDDEGYYTVWQRWSFMDPDMLLVIGTALAEASEEIAVFAPLFAVMLDYPSVENSIHDGALSWSTISTFGTVMSALYVLLLLELLAAYLVARCALSSVSSSSSSSSFKWWWDRFIKLGMPLVLIGVGLSVVLGLSA